MLSQELAKAAANVAPPPFVEVAAVAGGCGGGCGSPEGKCVCPVAEPMTFPPGKGAMHYKYGSHVKEKTSWRGAVDYGSDSPDEFKPPGMPYSDLMADAKNMTLVVGEATIAAGATAEVQIQPTQGRFSGYYVEIYAVDAANPQSRQRVRIGRFSVGDCPGDCRTITVFSDVFEANQACCNGRPLRSTFGRVNEGQEMRVDVNNPNAAGNILVQVIVRGYCHRGTCAC